MTTVIGIIAFLAGIASVFIAVAVNAPHRPCKCGHGEDKHVNVAISINGLRHCEECNCANFVDAAPRIEIEVE